MALLDKVVEIVNKAMNTEASKILNELREECPKQTGKTAQSFRIMRGTGEASVSVSGQGFLTSVRIGSTAESAYYADQGSGATKKYISFVPYGGVNQAQRPGANKVYSHGRRGWYDPSRQGFVKRVADRHR